MIFKGLCFILEGKSVYNNQDLMSEIYNVSKIHNLDKMLEYAEYNNLAVLYLSPLYGVVYADDKVKHSPYSLHTFNTVQLKLWSKVVSEQVFRECLKFFTLDVYLMMKNRRIVTYIKQELEIKGVKVHTPLITKDRSFYER